jgi:bifunctional N-acetylglucosamine-1-phosphate-uridyltransferase/glucosamine-1-phosphate-acetyltransferase GlmU-like protein
VKNFPKSRKEGLSMGQPEFARIAPDVSLGQDVKIYAFVNLYGCSIGDDSKIGKERRSENE